MTPASRTSPEQNGRGKRAGAGRKGGRNREFAVIAYSFLTMFVCLMGYFTWFQFVESEKFINSPYNKRQDLFVRRVVRGEIYSADGQVLA